MRPPLGAAPDLPNVDDERVRETRTYQFLTPVFGGGVKLPADDKDGSKPIDPLTPIRVPSIRGQLRFWWRAANPRGCETVKELYQAETEIFGGLKWRDPKDGEEKVRRSDLTIRVVKQPAKPSGMQVFKQGERFRLEPRMDAIAYAAFPLRGSDPDHLVHGTLHDFGDKSFNLEFIYSACFAQDVAAALWAWGSFGGLGGRTRRGFGALADLSGTPLPGLDDGWRKYVSGVDVDWPHLPALDARRIARPQAHDGLAALKKLLKEFHDLRQGSQLGRRPDGTGGRDGGASPGRSYWPEAESIRELTGRRLPKHQELPQGADAFPRAAFGMPIIFHFKDTPDPRDTTLQPREKEVDRFASPLVLRPYRDPSTKKVHALALELLSQIPESELKDGGGGSVRTSMTEAEASAMPRPPRAGELFPKMFHDPIGAYLDLLKGKS